MEQSLANRNDGNPSPPATTRPMLALMLLVAMLFLIRLTGPSDLVDYGQEAPTSYVLDAVKNGHWLLQWDVRGDVTSKPPLYTWLSAAISTAAGTVNRWTLCAPAALATWALALVIFVTGDRHFGRRAGLLAALMYVLSAVVIKQVALVRTDGLFSLLVALTALLAWRAWQRGAGWELFWLAGAAATLTKGPLGVVLGAGGLLAAQWERRTGNPSPIWGKQAMGLLLFAVIVLGWFGLAWREAGNALTDRMIVHELLGSAVSREEGGRMGAQFYLPTLYFLARFAPWSVVCFAAFWRTVTQPAPDDNTRRFERFLFCWFAAGLVIFSLAAHQRPDLFFPLVAPAALLGGRELARWLSRWSDGKVIAASTLISLGVLVVTGLQYHAGRLRNEAVAQTLAAETLADIVREKVGERFPLVCVDTSPVVQLGLDTVNPLVMQQHAVQLLQGNAAAFVAVRNLDAMLRELPTNAVHVVAEAPRTARTHMAVIGNRPALAWKSPMATLVGLLRLEFNGIRKFDRRDDDFWLEIEAPNAYVEFTNASSEPVLARVHFRGEGWETSEDVVVPPGEMRKVKQTK